jgi:hypothetical protein
MEMIFFILISFLLSITTGYSKNDDATVAGGLRGADVVVATNSKARNLQPRECLPPLFDNCWTTDEDRNIL